MKQFGADLWNSSDSAKLGRKWDKFSIYAQQVITLYFGLGLLEYYPIPQAGTLPIHALIYQRTR